MHSIKVFLKKHRLWNRATLVRAVTLLAAIFVFLSALFLLWVSSWRIPNLDSFQNRDVTQSTKIYDRTGKIVLYDVFQNVKRTVVPFENISPNVKNAVLAIEDVDFYNHKGIKITSIIRAIIANVTGLGYNQGGSTITQQVIKNSLLTDEKTISRKIKEWVLAPKLEKVLTKDQIFSVYLNEIPFGGNLYGVEEASQAFYGKPSSDLTIAQAAYLAAVIQAPTHYSPYGSHKDELESRKNLVLKEMLTNNFIKQDEYDKAKAEKVEFQPQSNFGIKAPHFVLEVRDQLVQKYGEQAVQQGGLKVITTLDYDIQQNAESLAKEYALQNKKNFDAENIGEVAIDPRNGDILSMVGSRDYFDKEIDGNFNITTAHRQPGSAFKPFAYAEAFMKGYTPDTVLFNVPTEFSTTCTPEGKPKYTGANVAACYMPVNYDGKYTGPMSMRDALAQSVNVPSIKTLYLAGMKDTLNLAQKMGIASLGDINQYGLTLVLGGGEVSMLDLTSAYGVFANDGARNPYRYILEVDDKNGNVLEKADAQPNPIPVMDPNIAEQVSDVLSDNNARTPAFGSNSPLYFPGHDVAVKTGTTNDYKDAVIVGYTPNIVIGAWAGNNDNHPMQKKIAAFIIAPYWNKVMNAAIKLRPNDTFPRPVVDNGYDLKPVLRGVWQGGISTPSSGGERLSGGVHDILYWVDKSDPRGPIPQNPGNDPQFNNWEYGVRNWVRNTGTSDGDVNVQGNFGNNNNNNNTNTSHDPAEITVTSPTSGESVNVDSQIHVSFTVTNGSPVTQVAYYLNNEYGGTAASPFDITFVPAEFTTVLEGRTNTLKLVFTDSSSHKIEKTIRFRVN